MIPYNDNGIFDDPGQPQHHHGSDFLKGFAAAFGGALLGSTLDNTRFGRWYNTSALIGFLGRLIALGGIFLVGLYIYFVIKVW